jgi:membrane protease YdiL (CAAX protease family)
MEEREKRPIDPFDPPKAHHLGMLFILVSVLIAPGYADLLPDTLLFCLAAWIIMARKGASPGEVFRLNRVSPGTLAFPIAVALVLSSVEVLILEGIDAATRGGLGQWAELFPSPLENPLALGEVLSVCVIVPIAEEMFFRGFFSSGLKTLGTGWSVVFPAVIFAFFHHPLAIVGAFVVALIAGLFTARHGSILPAIVFHATGNAYMVLLTAIDKRYGERVADILYYFICAAGVLLVLRIRPELVRLWVDIKSVLRDFVARPASRENAGRLFRHWSYIILALEILFTLVIIVAATKKGTPI